MAMNEVLNSTIKTNFLIKFETELIPDIEYYIRNVPIPGYSVSANTVYSYSSQPIEFYGGMLTFGNDISFDIILNENYTTRKNIDDYMFKRRNQKNGKLNQDNFDITVYILSNKSNPQNTIKYANFLLKQVGEIQKNTTGDEYHYFTITGSIQYYEWIET